MRTFNFSLLIIGFFALSIGSLKAQDQYEKKFHESYDVNKECLFEISNKFGNIKIDNTAEDKITIDAVIIVKSRSKEKADKLFDKITVTINKENNVVKAMTSIDNISTNNESFEIDYQVSMPAYLKLNLSNKYGDVTINELAGKTNIDVKYGSLNVNRISDDNEKPLSTVELGYCERSQINEFNWGNLIVKYSKIDVRKGKALIVSSKYSKVHLGTFSSIICEAGYDDYEIESVVNLVSTAKYSDMKIGKLSKKFKIDNKYGNINIDEVPDGFESIDVVSKYASVNIGVAPDASYMLNAKTSYADIKYPELAIKERIKEDFGMQIKGKAGNKETKSTITIQSEYGDVNLE